MLPGEPSQSAYLCDDVGTTDLVQYLDCSKTDLELVQQNAKKKLCKSFEMLKQKQRIAFWKGFCSNWRNKIKKEF